MKRPYRKVKVRGRTIDVHVKVWTDAHGPVPEGYLVHHKNHDKLDNRLANLELMTHAEHSRHHNGKHPRSRACDVCGSRYEPAPTKRARSKTCSGTCFRKLASAQRAGTGNGQAKLTEQQVREIRRRVSAGEMQKALVAEMGVAKITVSNIVNRKTWRHVA